MANVTYVVKWGDTLASIASKYGTTVSNLVKLNNIANPNKIIERFKLRKPKIIEFDENYRATKELTNLSIQYLKKSFNNEYNEIYKNSIISESNIQGDKAKLFEAKDREEEAEFINNTIEKIYNIDNQSRTCILTRDNKLNQELSECLESLDSKNKKYEFVLVVLRIQKLKLNNGPSSNFLFSAKI